MVDWMDILAGVTAFFLLVVWLLSIVEIFIR